MFLIAFFEQSAIKKPFIDFFTLMFYVAIVSLPQTVYLYVQSLSGDKTVLNQLKLFQHHYYLPFGLFLINVIAFIYLSNESSEENLIYDVSVQVMNYSNFIALLFVFPIFNVVYIYKTLKLYWRHKKKVQDVYSFDQGVSLRWIMEYIAGYVIFLVLIVLTQISFSSTFVDVIAGVFLITYLLYIGIRGRTQQVVLFNAQHLEKSNKENIKPSIENQFIEPSRIDEIKSNINLKIQDECYLNNSLTIHEFSKSIGSNSKYVSKILNTEYGQNFASFINYHRIQKSKELLTSETSGKYTIETISNLVGFKSKSAFNKAFKLFESTTPSAFKIKNQEVRKK